MHLNSYFTIYQLQSLRHLSFLNYSVSAVIATLKDYSGIKWKKRSAE
jgi:hypothetical protein